MRVFTLTAMLLITAITTVTAFAESDIPDLKGEWVMTYEAVIHSNSAEMPSKRISLHTSLEFNNKQQDKLFFSTSLTALLYAATEYRINAERS